MMLVTACSHVPPDFPSCVAIPKRITATASETQPVPLRTYLEPPMMGGGDRTKTLMIEEWIQDVAIVTFRLATHPVFWFLCHFMICFPMFFLCMRWMEKDWTRYHRHHVWFAWTNSKAVDVGMPRRLPWWKPVRGASESEVVTGTKSCHHSPLRWEAIIFHRVAINLARKFSWTVSLDEPNHVIVAT